MPRAKSPVSSFGPELQQTLRAGANRRLEIKFDSIEIATRFMHRINALRSAMKAERHPDAEHLYRCGVHKLIGDQTTLVIEPRDSEFRAALAAAGISGIDDPAPITKVHAPSPPPGEAPSADSFLATLVEETAILPVDKSVPDGENNR